jgi:hypothetical protein
MCMIDQVDCFRVDKKEKTPHGVFPGFTSRHSFIRGVEGIRTPDEGFADPCLTTWPRRHFKLLSGRWDSNPRPSPWQGDVLPLYYARNFWLTISRECRDTESNCGHRDFQSRALPTELSRLDISLLSVRNFTW